MKRIFNFPSFLTSLTLPPLEIMNKEIAAILGVQDTVISKIRHGKLKAIPGQLRPIKSSESFAQGIVKSVSSSQATLDTFAVYADQLMNDFQLSERLTQLVRQVCSDVGHSHMTPQMLQRSKTRIVNFFSHCYNESHFNSSTGSEKVSFSLSGPLIIPSPVDSKRTMEEIVDMIRQKEFSQKELEALERELVLAGFPEKEGRGLYYDTLYRRYADILKEQMLNPFYSNSHRRETISISDDQKTYKQRVTCCDHLVLRSEQPFSHYIQRTLLNFEHLGKKEFLESVFEDFDGQINGVAILDYINAHEGTEYKRLYDVIRVIRVPGGLDGIPVMRVHLPLVLYPSCAEETFVLETSYCSAIPFFPDYSTNFSYRLQYPCRFFSHEHLLTPETAEQWHVAMDVFSSLNSRENSEMDGQVYQRYNRVEKMPGRSQSVIFHDWVLQGSGYRRSIHRTLK